MMATYAGLDRRDKSWRNRLHRQFYPYDRGVEAAILIVLIIIVVARMVLVRS